MSAVTSATPAPPNVDDLEVAKVYADAAWEAACAQGVERDFVDEFHSLIVDVLDQEPQLEVFLRLGSVGRDRREEMLRTAFASASPLLRDFLLVLNRHDRLGALRAIDYRLHQLAAERDRRVPVVVRSAVTLSDSLRERIVSGVRSRFGVEPELRVVVDPRVLGGLMVRVGDVLYDYSTRSHLDRLKESILARSTHEAQR